MADTLTRTQKEGRKVSYREGQGKEVFEDLKLNDKEIKAGGFKLNVSIRLKYNNAIFFLSKERAKNAINRFSLLFYLIYIL